MKDIGNEVHDEKEIPVRLDNKKTKIVIGKITQGMYLSSTNQTQQIQSEDRRSQIQSA